MDGVAEPYRQRDADLYAGELLNGKWLVFRYEDFGDLDRLLCLAVLEVDLADAGIDTTIVDLPRKGVVLVANKAQLPTFEQVQSVVDRIEYDRFMDRELRSEFAAKTGRHP